MSNEKIGVLIFHGFTARLDYLREVEAQISAYGLQVHVPVLRGHEAESPEALRGVIWEDWVEDGKAALDDMLTKVDQAILIGHSMGGLVALTLGAEYGEKIDSIIPVATGVQLTSPFASGNAFHFLAPLVARLLKKWDFPPIYADPALAENHTAYLWAPMDATLSILDFAVAARKRLAEIEVPMLILQSHGDTTVARDSADIIYRETSTSGDQKKIIWFERTEHGMFSDCEKDAVHAAIIDFIQERI